MNLYSILKPILFKLDPEIAHEIISFGLNATSSCGFLNDFLAKKFCVKSSFLSQKILGIDFYNPVMLASGFDKNAYMIKALGALGFSCIEIGSVTRFPQKGNPKPRLFRLIEQKSLQNAMGFNNIGASKILLNIEKNDLKDIVVGANIGKNKEVSPSDAVNNYLQTLSILESSSHYFVFNVSSPNTPNLRDLQNEEFLKELFTKARSLTSKPLFLKVAPDLDSNHLVELCLEVIKAGADGIIFSNTTIDYSLVSQINLKDGKPFGGLSGEVLKNKSYEGFKILAKNIFGKKTLRGEDVVLISVGGINDCYEAYKRIKAGASLVQVFSSFIYEGPAVASNINKGLISLLQKDGFRNISQACGVDIK